MHIIVASVGNIMDGTRLACGHIICSSNSVDGSY
jgi:hypothetical protein